MRKSLYFHRVSLEKDRTSHAQSKYEDATPSVDGGEGLEDIKQSPEESIQDFDLPCDKFEQPSGFNQIWEDFLHAFSNMYVVKWSIWWALTQCGYLQVRTSFLFMFFCLLLTIIIH